MIVCVKELMDWHRPRLKALLEGGADVLAIETIPALKEAEAVVCELEKLDPGAKAWVSFSCKVIFLLCYLPCKL